MQDIAGNTAPPAWGGPSAGGDDPGHPKPRTVAATATPTANSVITVSAPFATDFSARTSVTSNRMAKNPAAASVAHIGNEGECQMWSNEETHAQFMRNVLQERLVTYPGAAGGTRTRKTCADATANPAV